MSAPDLPWIIASTEGAVEELSLLSSVLAGLGSLRDAGGANVAWQGALADLTTALANGLRPSAIIQADWDRLTADWAELQAALGNRLEPALQALTLPLSDVATTTFGDATAPGLLEYPLLASSKSVAGTQPLGGLSFAVAGGADGKAAMTVQVYDQTPDWASACGYQLPAGEVLVRFGLHGEIAAAANARAQPGWGGVAVSAGAQGAATLDHCYAYPPGRCLADVLLDSLPQMAAPGDLAGLLTSCQREAYALDVMELSGALRFGGSLEVGTALVGSTGAGLADWAEVAVAKPATASANIGATLGYDWGLDGDFRIVARRVDQSLSVRIDRVATRTSGASVNVSATLDVDGLQAMLDPVMAKVMPSADALVARLGALADLRGLARDALARQLGLAGSGTWGAIANQLVNIATGGDSATAGTEIADALAQAFDDDAKETLRGAAAGTLSQSVQTLLQSAVISAGAFSPAFAVQLDGAIAEVRTRIDAAYAGFAASLGAAIDAGDQQLATAITAALDAPAADAAALMQGLQQRADAATGKLVGWLDAYEAARRRVAAAVAQVEREKLAVGWAATFQKQRGSSALVEVLIAKATPRSQALYAALRGGRLELYGALLAACAAEGSAEEVACLFRESQARRSQYSFAIDLFGLAAGSATVGLMDSVSVDADRTGRIVAASDNIDLEMQLSARGRVADAVLAIDLQMLALPGAAPGLHTAYTVSGAAFSEKDSDDFFSLLERAAAVAAGTSLRVRDLLGAAASGSAAAFTDAALGVMYAPDAAGWARLLATDAAAVEIATRSQCLRLLGMAIELGIESGTSEGTPASWAAEWAGQAGMQDGAFWASAKNRLWSDWYNRLLEAADLGFPQAHQMPANPLQRSIRQLWIIQRISAGAGSAWAAIGEANALLTQLGAATAGLSRADVLHRLSDLSDRIVSGFSNALVYETPDGGKPAKVSWQYLGPILALASLAEAQDGPALITRVRATVRGQPVAQLLV